MEHADTQRETLDQLAAEFVESLRAGQTPALSDYADRYPEYASQIHDLFPTLVKLEQLAPAPQRLWTEPLGEADQVGHYRILGEIGRGGMGIVYEAQDMRLDRFVALKVLPAGLDAVGNSLERFEREARSAGRLHHTHIVPVFEAGEADGFHFIAMQKIDGEGLDEVLREIIRVRGDRHGNGRHVVGARPQRDAGQSEGGPSAATDSRTTMRMDPARTETLVDTGTIGQKAYFQNVARLGVQIADAISYAHSQGVVHRDIKPSNILIDNRQNAWVTDFGLAKLEEESLTGTGDIVGTLRYMAPERFLGQVDARSDVYGIGITLYEMLAFEPAFPESDRVRLLRSIQVQDPSPVSRVNPLVPPDLATIVSRSIARNPADRYFSAADLAEDLRLFLDKRPIKARSVSLRETLVRWYRRKPALATAVTALVCVFLLSFLAVSWQWHRANTYLEQSRQEATRAEENLQQAQELVDLLADVSDNKLRDIPSAQSVRRELVEETLRYYQSFLDQSQDQNETTRRIAHAYLQAAYLKSALTLEDAAGDFRKALKMYNKLVVADPKDMDLRHGRANASLMVGRNLTERDQAREAIPYYQQSVRDMQVIMTDGPLASQHVHLLASAYNNIGFAHVMLMQLDDVDAWYEKALALRQQLVEEMPDELAYQSALAQIYNDTAYLRQLQHRYEQALKWDHEALRLRASLIEREPMNPKHRYDYASSINHIGDDLRAQHDYQGAIVKYRESLRLHLQLHEAHPKYVRVFHGILNNYVNLARSYELTKMSDDSEQAYRSAIDVLQKLLSEDSENARYQRQLSHILYKLATFRNKAGESTEADELIRQAADLSPTAPEVCHGIARHMFLYPDSQFDYAQALACAQRAVDSALDSPHHLTYLNTFGCILYRLDRYEEAIATLRQVGEMDKKGMTALGYLVMAMSHYQLGDASEAAECYGQAVEWLESHDKMRPEQRKPLDILQKEAAEMLGDLAVPAASGS